MCVVGMEKDKHVIIMNSWGTDFGDKGFFYMPWEYYFSNNVESQVFIVELVQENGDIRILDRHRKRGILSIIERHWIQH